jgi:predicted transcriptional regulator
MFRDHHATKAIVNVEDYEKVCDFLSEEGMFTIAAEWGNGPKVQLSNVRVREIFQNPPTSIIVYPFAPDARFTNIKFNAADFCFCRECEKPLTRAQFVQDGLCEQCEGPPRSISRMVFHQGELKAWTEGAEGIEFVDAEDVAEKLFYWSSKKQRKH